jgi:hypothetical protein
MSMAACCFKPDRVWVLRNLVAASTAAGDRNGAGHALRALRSFAPGEADRIEAEIGNSIVPAKHSR